MTENQGQYAPPPAPVAQESDPAPEPVADEAEAPSPAPAAETPSVADEPVTVAPVPPEVPEADAAAPDQPGGVITADNVHPGVLVRLRDVLAHVENFLARHPHLKAIGESDLKSALATLEPQQQGPVPPTTESES